MINLLGIGDIIGGVGKIADDLITTDEERLKIALQEKQIDADLVKGQLEINKTEAQSSSVFVAGWRPFIGWVGGIALAYQFVAYPLMTWVWQIAKAHGWIDTGLNPPPVLDAQELWVILTGMLGMAGLRSYDKVKGTDSSGVSALTVKKK